MKQILEMAGGEEIIGVVIGEFGWGRGWGSLGYEEEKCKKQIPWEIRGRVLSWDEAKEWLDYEYDPGYGAPECHAVFAWAKNRVFFVQEYDGATCVSWIPRHPIPCKPTML